MRCLALLPLVGALTVAACGDGENPVTEDDDGDMGTGGGATNGPDSSCVSEPGECEDLGSDRPFRLSEHGAAYIEGRGQMVVFGGTNAVAEACNFPAPDYHAETWLFDEGCGKWKQLSIDDGPSPRARHSMTYGDGLVWLFGGRWGETDSTDTEYIAYNELWTFDLDSETWQENVPDGDKPPARANSAIAWDSKRHALWVWGGNIVQGGTFAAADDLWRYDPKDNRWTKVAAQALEPAPRLYQSLVYDERRDQLIVYGGTDQDLIQDAAVWGLSLEDLSWSRLDVDADRRPDTRYWQGMVLDKDNDRLVMMGGHDNTSLGNRNDWWFFDLERQSWSLGGVGDTLNSSANGFCDFPPDFASVDLDVPERRHGHSMVWSEACGHAIVFAGKTDCGATDDVWLLNGEGWTRRTRASEGEVCIRWREDPADCNNLCN